MVRIVTPLLSTIGSYMLLLSPPITHLYFGEIELVKKSTILLDCIHLQKTLKSRIGIDLHFRLHALKHVKVVEYTQFNDTEV